MKKLANETFFSKMAFIPNEEFFDVAQF